MRILIYAHSFSPAVGGAETYVMLLARGLSSKGAGVHDNLGEPDVTVATCTPAGAPEDLNLPFRVVRCPSTWTLWRLVGEHDLVQLAGPVFLPMLLAFIRRKPVVVEHHIYQAICPNGLLVYHPTHSVCPGHFKARRYDLCLRCNWRNSSFARSLYMLLLAFPRYWLCRRVDRNIAVTNHVNCRLDLPRTQTIYHGVHPPEKMSAPTAIRPSNYSKAKSESKRPCFGFVGRFVEEKGIRVLLNAAGLLKSQGYQFGLKLIGDGPERANLETIAEDLHLGPNVSFTGFLSGEELARALSDVAAVVVPSTWEELAPLAPIEHMMRGRLVIASDIGGLGEEVNGAGLKFPPGSVDGLASCMRKVLDEPSIAGTLGKKARERALEFFLHGRMIQEHRGVYSKLLNLSNSRSTD